MVSRIAISLVIRDEFPRTLEMLKSLVASDLLNHEVGLFVKDNASVTPNFCDELKKVWPGSYDYDRYTTNKVNVLPRIEIMDEVLADPLGYAYLLEIHTDMLFPREWFAPLLSMIQHPKAGIVFPWILNNRRVLPEEIELLAGRHRETRKDINPTQVLPWLLKLEVVRKVGYYDPAYHPGRCEDDDFLYRMYQSGHLGIASQDSVVAHQGGFHSYRRELLPPNQNEKIFQRKFGTTIEKFKTSHSVHPVILV